MFETNSRPNEIKLGLNQEGGIAVYKCRVLQKYKVISRMRSIAGLLVASALIVGCGKEPQVQPMPMPVAIVTKPVVEDVTSYYHYTGILAPVEQVDVRARVSGRLEEMSFEASTQVEVGEQLFRIEPEPYEIAVRAAQAEMAQAEAILEEANITKDRLDKAAEAGAAQPSEVLAANAKVKQAAAALEQAKQSLADAELKLDYTYVRSPIQGRVSRQLVDVGNLVGMSESTHLTTVTKMDPIWAYFDVSERIVLEYLARDEPRPKDAPKPSRPIQIALASTPHGTYPFHGTINWFDNQVDENTGTIRVRAEFENKEGKLFPGLFIRARAPYEVTEDATLIPENAIMRGLDGPYIYVVDDQNVVRRRVVALGDLQGDLRVVTRGLEATEQVVISGLQKVKPGKPCQPKYASDLATQTHAAGKDGSKPATQPVPSSGQAPEGEGN